MAGIDQQNGWGQTELLATVLSRRHTWTRVECALWLQKVCSLLLDGADPGIANDQHHTALFYAEQIAAYYEEPSPLVYVLLLAGSTHTAADMKGGSKEYQQLVETHRIVEGYLQPYLVHADKNLCQALLDTAEERTHGTNARHACSFLSDMTGISVVYTRVHLDRQGVITPQAGYPCMETLLPHLRSSRSSRPAIMLIGAKFHGDTFGHRCVCVIHGSSRFELFDPNGSGSVYFEHLQAYFSRAFPEAADSCCVTRIAQMFHGLHSSLPWNEGVCVFACFLVVICMLRFQWYAPNELAWHIARVLRRHPSSPTPAIVTLVEAALRCDQQSWSTLFPPVDDPVCRALVNEVYGPKLCKGERIDVLRRSVSEPDTLFHFFRLWCPWHSHPNNVHPYTRPLHPRGLR